MEINIDLVLTDRLYNVRQDLGRQASDYDLLGEDDFVEMVDVCGSSILMLMHTHSALPFKFRHALTLFLPKLKSSPSRTLRATSRYETSLCLTKRNKDWLK